MLTNGSQFLDLDQAQRDELFVTLKIFLKQSFESVDFEEKNQQTTKNHEKIPSMQRVKYII